MELVFLALLVVFMAVALGSGYPVAFALPGAAITAISLAAVCGYIFAGNVDAYFFQDGPGQWLSAGVTNLRGVYWEVERDTLIAIPLFIFMGIMLQRSKVAEDLLITMAQLFGSVPGGLGVSVVFVGALLAATTGIVGATVVAMGLISLPAMMRNNYSNSLSTGIIAASGTLGQIIPPSIVLIILADQLASASDQASSARKALHKAATGELTMPSSFDVISTSAGEMFLGALVPGLVLVALYMIYILVYAMLRPHVAPAVKREGELNGEFFFKLGLALVPPLALIFLVLGSILSGVATVNQAGAIGAAGALLMASYRLTDGQKGSFTPAILAIVSIFVIGVVVTMFNTNIKAIDNSQDALGVGIALFATLMLLVALVWSARRAYTIENTLQEVMVETAKATSLVFIILLGAAMLTAAFRAFGGEELVKQFLDSLPGGFWSQFITVMAVIFILGFFLDFIEIAVVVVPIVAPILLADPSANITAVWLGVMIGLNIQTSFLTPPFGFALFYLRGVAPAIVKTLDMYKGVIAFILLQIGALIIVANYPPLVNYLPNRVAYLSDTAPPPRNPKLQLCLEDYVAEQAARADVNLHSLISDARVLDYTGIPAEQTDRFLPSFDVADEALQLLGDIQIAALKVEQDSANYRPIHTTVREIEANARKLDAEMKTLRTTVSRSRGDDKAERREQLNKVIASLEAQKEDLLSGIPQQWQSTNEKFAILTRTEDQLRIKYRRAADDSYRPIADIAELLGSTEQLMELRTDMDGVHDLVAGSEAGAAVALLDSLLNAFDGVTGVDTVTADLTSAAAVLGSEEPDMNEALTLLDTALVAYGEEYAWRSQISPQTITHMTAYEKTLRGSLGIRSQQRMTREQALYVAACSSGHRDVSLQF
jgi:tripartite ATP-independent transporter DctM subunit